MGNQISYVKGWVKKRRIVVLCLLTFAFAIVFSEEVCKLTYTGYPEDLHDTVLVVPEEIVALSEYIFVGSPTFINENITNEPTIFFVIDHSGSMFEQYQPEVDSNAPYDIWGNRFNVTRDLLDTLYQKVPKAEVGIAVFRQWPYFFYEDDPDVFDTYPGEDYWGYIPLFRLDSVYTPPGKMGYEIIKDYLRTDTVTLEYPPYWDYVTLEYIPTDFWLNGTYTNINSGFECAKDAMRLSQHPKDQHFIIFISDGLASWPEDGTKDDYIEGEDVPTTYTIFFTPNPDPPQSLQDMTANIKTNGYSTSNPRSFLWAFDNTDYDKLMTFLKDSVIFSIDLIQTNNPIVINVNGTSNPNPWDSSGFLFDDLFPLVGDTTPFVLKIDYHVFVDSITQNGDTISFEKDTTTNIEFDVVVENNAVLPDSVIVDCWDRKIEFYHNGNLITLADETMDDIEVRFTETEVDILYGYEDVSLEIKNTEAANPDEENFDLEDKGSYFSYTFPREIDSNPDQGDGTLGHAILDSIVATFRNPKLPLDTLRVTIPFKVSTLIEIRFGVYFDNDADGYIDSIYIEVEGDLTDAHVDKLKDLITLPKFRNFQNVQYSLTPGGLAVNCEQKDKSSPWDMITYVTDEDSLVVKEEILNVGGWVKAATVPLLDRVAPIIMKGHLINYEDNLVSDTLIVEFSEQVLRVTKDRPFYFKSIVGGTEYDAEVRLTDDDSTIMEFEVLSVSDKVDDMHAGDSIWIYWQDEQVGDVLFNYQENKKNRRRMLTVKIKLIPFELLAHAIVPLDLSNIPEATAIPQDIIDALKDKGILGDLSLDKNKNGKHTGMLLQIIPKDPEKLNPDYFEMKGNVSIFDAVGNDVILTQKMGFYKEKKSLFFVWNGRNANGRYVGSGTYLAIFEVTPKTGPLLKERPVKILEKFIGVKE